MISGGHTGTDLAAVDWAIKNKISHGGWCPKAAVQSLSGII
jgi:hypothetical protein